MDQVEPFVPLENPRIDTQIGGSGDSDAGLTEHSRRPVDFPNSGHASGSCLCGQTL
jgi:hypothetical protein